MIHIAYGNGRTALDCFVKQVGEDLCIIVQGGNRPHIGAVAIGIPRASLKYEFKISSTVSVYSFIGHKEDLIARSMAERIASSLNRKVVLMVGVHIDNLTEDDIHQILLNSEGLAENVINAF